MQNNMLSGLTRQAIKPLALSTLLGAGGALFLIIQMGLLAHMVTMLAFRHASFTGLGPVAGWFLLATLLRICCQGAAETTGDLAALRVTSSLRLEILAHLYQVGPVGLTQTILSGLSGQETKQHEGQETGKIATVLTEGIDALNPYIARFVPRAAAMITTPLLILAVIFALDKWSFLILAITGPLVPFFMALVGYGAQNVMDRKWAELLLLGSSFLDMVQGLTSLRLFGRAWESVSLVSKLADDHRKSTMAVMRIAFMTSAVLEFFSSLSIALVAVIFGIRLLHGSVSFETSFFVLLLAPEYFMPLRTFSASYHDRQNAQSAFAALNALHTRPPLIASNLLLPDGPRSRTEPRQFTALHLEHVSARYTPETPLVLHDINLVVPQNTLSVITGPSGAGKTTLMRLVLGTLPATSGRLFLTTAEGRDHPVQEALIGWVPQNPLLIMGSIADNLRLAAPDATKEEMEQAAREAAAWEFITALPHGLETQLAEGGSPLSMGQIRRLALARALLRHPTLLLFDEPTADLDPDNAELVVQAIRRSIDKRSHAGRIVLVISHRDDVLALARQNGQIIPLTPPIPHPDEQQTESGGK